LNSIRFPTTARGKLLGWNLEVADDNGEKFRVLSRRNDSEGDIGCHCDRGYQNFVLVYQMAAVVVRYATTRLVAHALLK
jgi:hypothetical protein